MLFSSIMNTSKSFMPLDRFAIRLKKWLGKKLHNVDQNVLDHCKIETCTYKILVAAWKHTSRWASAGFLSFLGPKFELHFLRGLLVLHQNDCQLMLLWSLPLQLTQCQSLITTDNNHDGLQSIVDLRSDFLSKYAMLHHMTSYDALALWAGQKRLRSVFGKFK